MDCILVKESATLVLRQVSDAEGLIEEGVYVSFLALTSGISVLNEASLAFLILLVTRQR